MDNVYEVPNFLTAEEIAIFEDYLTNPDKWSSRSERRHDPNLGREIYTIFLPDEIRNVIHTRVENLVGRNLNMGSLSLVDYDAKYGQPNLPPHFDGDNNSLIVDYQYKANTSWGLGVGSKLFDMTDNKAIIFNPNEYPHWRPHKTFQEGESMTMIFFRFPGGQDYSHMRYRQDHEIFDEARKVRDSLKSEGIAE